MILESLQIGAAEFAAGTGWEMKPEGACRGSSCVPLGGDPGGFDLNDVAERLGMALVNDADHDLWALGPASVSGRVLDSADAPDLVLPDLEGTDFRLASLRGQKVVLVAWAPY